MWNILIILFFMLPCVLCVEDTDIIAMQSQIEDGVWCCSEMTSSTGIIMRVSWIILLKEYISFNFDIFNNNENMPVSGYIGFGVMRAATTRSMVGGISDFWMGYPTNNSIEDYSFSGMKLRKDEQDDLMETKMTVTTDKISLQCRRKLKTLDYDYDVVISDGPYKVLFAYRYTETRSGIGGRIPSGMGSSKEDINFFHCDNQCQQQKK